MFSLSSFSERLFRPAHPVWQDNRLLALAPPLQLFGALAILFYASWPLTEPVSGPVKILLVLLTGWALFSRGRQLLSSPAVWLFAASILIQILSWSGVLLQHPEWAESSPKLHRLSHWFLFIAIACWLGGSTRNTLRLWLVALLALLLAPWIVGGGLAEWKAGAAGQRIDFGLHNAQHTAMLFGSALIGLLVLAPRLFGAVKPLSVWGALWLGALTLCALAVLYSQTRAVWLGLAVAALFPLLAGLRALYLRWGARLWPRVLAGSVLFAALLMVFGPKVADIVSERMAQEGSTIDAVLSGNIDSAAYNSTGIRVHMWMEALPWIKERPLLGWGGKGRSLVIARSENLPQFVKDAMGHLHNSYLDLQVNNGALGLLLLLALIGWLLVASVKAWKKGHLPGDLLLFFLTFMLYWLVINCFESYMFFSSGSFVFSMICGGVITHVWRGRAMKASDD